MTVSTGDGTARAGGTVAAGLGPWRAVLLQSLRDLRTTDAPEVAAALAFYALLSLFPLLLAGTAATSWFLEPGWAVARIAHLLGEFVPSGEVEVEAIVGGAIAQRGRVGVLSVLVLLVSGRRVLGALAKALDRVSDVDEHRGGLLRRAAVELAMLLGVAALFALALSSGPLLGLLWRTAEGAPWPARAASAAALEAARGALLLASFFLVYYFVPRGERVKQAALAGAAAAALLFLLARALFLLWVDRLWGSVSLVYGPLAVGAVLLLWAWYAALITLFGGSLASHAKVMLVEGRSAAEAGRRHTGDEGQRSVGSGGGGDRAGLPRPRQRGRSGPPAGRSAQPRRSASARDTVRTSASPSYPPNDSTGTQ